LPGENIAALIGFLSSAGMSPLGKMRLRFKYANQYNNTSFIYAIKYKIMTLKRGRPRQQKQRPTAELGATSEGNREI